MGIFSQGEAIKTMNRREDYNLRIINLPVEEHASSVLTLKRYGKRVKSWLLCHELVKPCYGVPGIQDGTKILLTCSRDVIWDALNQLDDSWSPKNINLKFGEMAKEQQYIAEMNKNSGSMNTSVILLSAAAVILFIAIALVGLLSYYRG